MNARYNNTNTFSVYVASLSDYNNGHLHGVWIDLMECDLEEVQDEIQAMLAESKYQPAEDWAIHDSETDMALSICEYESLETLVKAADLIEEHGDVALAWIGLTGLNQLDELEDQCVSVADSLADYAYEYLENMGTEIPTWIHVDYEATGRDLTKDSSVVRFNGSLYIFK